MGMEFYEYLTRKAKKNHICEMCGKTIYPDEEYSVEIGKYDGDFFYRKLHNDCYNVLYEYFNDCEDDWFDYDGIRFWFIEKYCKMCSKHTVKCNNKIKGLFCKYNYSGTCDKKSCDGYMPEYCWCKNFSNGGDDYG